MLSWWKKAAVPVLFLIVIFVVAALNLKNLYHIVAGEIGWNPSQIENTYNDNFYSKMSYINLQGGLANLMDQKILNGVIKGDNGKLNFLWAVDYKFNEKEEAKKVKKAIAILQHAEKKGCKVLYVQRPWAVSAMPYGKQFEYSRQYDYWCKQIKKAGIPTIDLRSEMEGELDFFTTDHHWTTESAYCATARIIQELNQLYYFRLADRKVDFFNEKNYIRKTYNNVFLGAEGVRTGTYFAGKDDFEIVYPKFDTKFLFQQYSEGTMYWEKEGDYQSVLIDQDLLNDETYLNKYNAHAYGAYNENRVKNEKAGNNLKTLLIADSFARSQLGFYSLCFKETRYLDPQEGRYTDSYVKYIDEYQPDIVILMFPGDGNFVKV